MHVEEADADRGQQAHDRNDQQRPAADVEIADQRCRAGLGADIGIVDQRRNRRIQLTLNGRILIDRGIDTGGDEQLTGAAGEYAARALAERDDVVDAEADSPRRFPKLRRYRRAYRIVWSSAADAALRRS